MLYDKKGRLWKEKEGIRGRRVFAGICFIVAAAFLAKAAMSFAPYRNVPAVTKKGLPDPGATTASGGRNLSRQWLLQEAKA